MGDSTMWLTVVEPSGLETSGKTRDPVLTVDEQPNIQRVAQHGVHVKLSFVNSSEHSWPTPSSRLATKVSYFRGNDAELWRPDVPVWGVLRYDDLYPGINLVIGKTGGKLPWQLEALPGADWSIVQLRVEGIEDLRLDAGCLRTQLCGRRNAAGDTLAYATFIGGDQPEKAQSLGVDHAGKVVAAGFTSSQNFPVTASAFDTTHNGAADAFVVKLALPTPVVPTNTPTPTKTPTPSTTPTRTPTATVTLTPTTPANAGAMYLPLFLHR